MYRRVDVYRWGIHMHRRWVDVDRWSNVYRRRIHMDWWIDVYRRWIDVQRWWVDRRVNLKWRGRVNLNGIHGC
jgi:hypothetical protein